MIAAFQTVLDRSFSCRTLRAGAVVLLASLLVMFSGCGAVEEKKPRAALPMPQYTGPAFLHGSIGSMTTLRGRESHMVSGWGLVVDLNGKGSGNVPAYLRQQFLIDMRRNGVKNPSAMLASRDTAIVKVQGLVPAGAVKGQKFDLLVEALPEDVETVSLYGGKLWTTELAVGGANKLGMKVKPVAVGRGPVYANPLNVTEKDKQRLHRRAAVLSGGSLSAARRIDLVLNQPSWTRSQEIGDRINEVFFHERATEFFNTAVPKTDQVIQIHLPKRYEGRPSEFLTLIGHLYLKKGEQWQLQQAHALANLMIEQPQHTTDVVYCWHAMGRQIIPALREYYDHPDRRVQMAAMKSGARLGDLSTATIFEEIARTSPDARERLDVADALQYLPESRMAMRTLALLLDDENADVRLRAYEALLAAGNSRVKRFMFGTEMNFKFVLDLVPAKRPMIYIAHERMPRIAIFDPKQKISTSLAGIWDNRMMIKRSSETGKIDIYYTPIGAVRGETFTIGDTVADLISFMSHRASDEFPTPGLNLTYSHVVDALHQLKTADGIEAPMQIERSTLADAIAMWEREQYGESGRPEVAAGDATDPGAGEFIPLNVDDGTGNTDPTPPAPEGGRPEIGPAPDAGSRPEIGPGPGPGSRPELPPTPIFEDPDAEQPTSTGGDADDVEPPWKLPPLK